MNTTDKIINELAIQIANKTVENANLKVLLSESQEALEAINESQEALEAINKVMEANPELKELFDEAEKGM